MSGERDVRRDDVCVCVRGGVPGLLGVCEWVCVCVCVIKVALAVLSE